MPRQKRAGAGQVQRQQWNAPLSGLLDFSFFEDRGNVTRPAIGVVSDMTCMPIVVMPPVEPGQWGHTDLVVRQQSTTGLVENELLIRPELLLPRTTDRGKEAAAARTLAQAGAPQEVVDAMLQLEVIARFAERSFLPNPGIPYTRADSDVDLCAWVRALRGAGYSAEPLIRAPDAGSTREERLDLLQLLIANPKVLPSNMTPLVFLLTQAAMLEDDRRIGEAPLALKCLAFARRWKANLADGPHYLDTRIEALVDCIHGLVGSKLAPIANDLAEKCPRLATAMLAKAARSSLSAPTDAADHAPTL